MFFAPQGRHVALMVVKFGMEDWTEGLLPHAECHPHRCNDKDIGLPKLKFLLRFDQNVEYKRPAGAYPLRDFHKICRICISLQDALAAKISLDLLKGYAVIGVLSWRGLVIPKFSAPPSGETMRQTSKSFRGTRTCSRSSIIMPSLVGFGFHPPPRRPKTLSFFVCLAICLSRFWTPEFVRPISPWRRWSTEGILITLDRGRFVVVQPCSTFSDCCQLATPLNAKVQKTAKIGGFRCQRATE